MITDAAVETATAVLEERGWERDDEMVRDVRAALEAVQAELVATTAEERRRLAGERARRQAESKRQARWRHVPPEARAD